MAIKLNQHVDKDIPGTVNAVIAKRFQNLEAQSVAKLKNEEKVTKAGQILNQMHKVQL